MRKTSFEEKISHKLSPPSPKRRQVHGREEKLYISPDQTLSILLKLPMTSLVRFRCVSKLWSSLINDTIKTRSLTQSRLLVIFSDSWAETSSFSTYPQNTKTRFLSAEKQSHTETHELNCSAVYRYVNGLVCCCSISDQLSIYNPTTRQSFLLPGLSFNSTRNTDFLFGYDPVANQYKVLYFISKRHHTCRVFTWGGPKKQQQYWKTIRRRDGHTPSVTNVCINGIIYYIEGCLAVTLGSFHVRYERFDRIEMPETLQMEKDLTLVNYRGKLGCIRCTYGEGSGEMWIMEDSHDQKQEWFKITLFMYPPHLSASLQSGSFVIAGVTRDGEIMIMPKSVDFAERLYVYFHDPKQNKIRRVELESNLKLKLKRRIGIRLFSAPDHMENTMPLFRNESATAL